MAIDHDIPQTPPTSDRVRTEPRRGSSLPMFIALAASVVVMGYVLLSLQNNKALDRALNQAQAGATPVVAAGIRQTLACVQQGVRTYHGPNHWDQAQLVVWTPCVQQGDLALQSQHADDQVAALHERLQPLEALVARRFR